MVAAPRIEYHATTVPDALHSDVDSDSDCARTGDATASEGRSRTVSLLAAPFPHDDEMALDNPPVDAKAHMAEGNLEAAAVQAMHMMQDDAGEVASARATPAPIVREEAPSRGSFADLPPGQRRGTKTKLQGVCLQLNNAVFSAFGVQIDARPQLTAEGMKINIPFASSKSYLHGCPSVYMIKPATTIVMDAVRAYVEAMLGVAPGAAPKQLPDIELAVSSSTDLLHDLREHCNSQLEKAFGDNWHLVQLPPCGNLAASLRSLTQITPARPSNPVSGGTDPRRSDVEATPSTTGLSTIIGGLRLGTPASDISMPPPAAQAGLLQGAGMARKRRAGDMSGSTTAGWHDLVDDVLQDTASTATLSHVTRGSERAVVTRGFGARVKAVNRRLSLDTGDVSVHAASEAAPAAAWGTSKERESPMDYAPSAGGVLTSPAAGLTLPPPPMPIMSSGPVLSPPLTRMHDGPSFFSPGLGRSPMLEVMVRALRACVLLPEPHVACTRVQNQMKRPLPVAELGGSEGTAAGSPFDLQWDPASTSEQAAVLSTTKATGSSSSSAAHGYVPPTHACDFSPNQLLGAMSSPPHAALKRARMLGAADAAHFLSSGAQLHPWQELSPSMFISGAAGERAVGGAARVRNMDST